MSTTKRQPRRRPVAKQQQQASSSLDAHHNLDRPCNRFLQEAASSVFLVPTQPGTNKTTGVASTLPVVPTVGGTLTVWLRHHWLEQHAAVGENGSTPTLAPGVSSNPEEDNQALNNDSQGNQEGNTSAAATKKKRKKKKKKRKGDGNGASADEDDTTAETSQAVHQGVADEEVVDELVTEEEPAGAGSETAATVPSGVAETAAASVAAEGSTVDSQSMGSWKPRDYLLGRFLERQSLLRAADPSSNNSTKPTNRDWTGFCTFLNNNETPFVVTETQVHQALLDIECKECQEETQRILHSPNLYLALFQPPEEMSTYRDYEALEEGTLKQKMAWVFGSNAPRPDEVTSLAGGTGGGKSRDVASREKQKDKTKKAKDATASLVWTLGQWRNQSPCAESWQSNIDWTEEKLLGLVWDHVILEGLSPDVILGAHEATAELTHSIRQKVESMSKQMTKLLWKLEMELHTERAKFDETVGHAETGINTTAFNILNIVDQQCSALFQRLLDAILEIHKSAHCVLRAVGCSTLTSVNNQKAHYEWLIQPMKDLWSSFLGGFRDTIDQQRVFEHELVEEIADRHGNIPDLYVNAVRREAFRRVVGVKLGAIQRTVSRVQNILNQQVEVDPLAVGDNRWVTTWGVRLWTEQNFVLSKEIKTSSGSGAFDDSWGHVLRVAREWTETVRDSSVSKIQQSVKQRHDKMCRILSAWQTQSESVLLQQPNHSFVSHMRLECDRLLRATRAAANPTEAALVMHEQLASTLEDMILSWVEYPCESNTPWEERFSMPMMPVELRRSMLVQPDHCATGKRRAQAILTAFWYQWLCERFYVWNADAVEQELLVLDGDDQTGTKEKKKTKKRGGEASKRSTVEKTDTHADTSDTQANTAEERSESSDSEDEIDPLQLLKGRVRGDRVTLPVGTRPEVAREERPAVATAVATLADKSATTGQTSKKKKKSKHGKVAPKPLNEAVESEAVETSMASTDSTDEHRRQPGSDDHSNKDLSEPGIAATAPSDDSAAIDDSHEQKDRSLAEVTSAPVDEPPCGRAGVYEDSGAFTLAEDFLLQRLLELVKEGNIVNG